MQSKSLTKLAICLSCLGFSTNLFAYPLEPRVYGWAMGGSTGIARADAMLPLYNQPSSSLFYNDFQGEYGTDEAWYVGAGLGYRTIANPGIIGGYLFIDRNVSEDHDSFYVLNPGVELFHCRGIDLRLNGYIPVSEREKRGKSFFPGIHDTCGENINTDQSIFIGHQQFQHHFHNLQEVGPGVDGEVGAHFCRANDLSIYGGGYYYHLREDNDIKGVEARAVLPIKPTFAFTAEASYDNYQRGAIVAGIRVQVGHLPHCPPTLCDRLYDPVIRNLGTVKSGSGIPIVKTTKDDGLALFRDNIYFFTGTGGTTFDGTGTGTFENPLANTQFTQTTVDGIDAIAPNANLFFNTGTYVVNFGQPGTPNASVSLPGGQSMFGRTEDFRNSAIGAQRPLFLGRLELLEGNNTLDSIILTNAFTNPTGPLNTITLNIQDAPNVFLCNDEINTVVTVTGNNTNTLFLSGIYANNSEVDIHKSVINTSATVGGINSSQILLTGIGGNNVATQNNIFAITDSAINVTFEGQSNSTTGRIFTVGIGNNAFNASANFSGNDFLLKNTAINSQVELATTSGNAVMVSGIGTNISSTTNQTANFVDNNFNLVLTEILSESRIATNNSDNLIVGIGGNSTILGDARFINNTFNLLATGVTSTADVPNNTSSVFVAGIGGNSTFGGISNFEANTFDILGSSVDVTSNSNNSLTNYLVAIGGNSITGGTSSQFIENIFNIAFTDLSVESTIANSNTSHLSAVIGGNAGFSATSNFTDNSFRITNSNLTSDNTLSNTVSFTAAVGIGGNAFNSATAIFQDNNFILRSDTIQVNETVVGANSFQSFAAGIGGNGSVAGRASFLGDDFEILNSIIDVTANSATNPNVTSVNFAAGIGINTRQAATTLQDSTFSIINTNISALAEITGASNGVNSAVGLGANVTGIVNTTTSDNVFTFTNDQVNATASVGTNNVAAENLAAGIGANVSDEGILNNNNNVTSVNSSSVSSLAEVIQSNSGANASVGIGGNAARVTAINNFTQAIFNLTNSDIVGTARTSSNIGNSANLATGFGANVAFPASIALFTDVIANIVNSNFTARALISGNNSATDSNMSAAIGGNGHLTSNVFDNFSLTMVGGTLNSLSQIGGDNFSLNLATGFGGNATAGQAVEVINSTVNFTDIAIDILAQVVGVNNNASNIATGFKADNGTTVTVTDSTGTITAQIGSGAGVNTNLAQVSETTGTGVVLTPGSNFVVTP